MAMHTPPRASVERELGRVTPTPPGPRYRPSYIPLPTPAATTASNSNSSSSSSGVNVRAGLQHRLSESGDDVRTGRSSSLSARTSSPALAPTSIPAPSSSSLRPPQYASLQHTPVLDAAGPRAAHQRSYSASPSGLDSVSASPSGSDSISTSVTDEADDGERILPVKVAVRIRPLAVGSGEQQQQLAGRGALTSCLEAVAGGTIAVSGTSLSQLALADGAAGAQRAFHFDYAFGPDAGQAAVYDAAVAPLLARFVEGYNVTVLAYGQTSSGKTHTMGTESGDAGAAESGVVPRALRWLFAHRAAQAAVRVSFLEVYNDELIDLVAQAQRRGVRPPVFVREDARGHVVWTGVTEVGVADADAALALLAAGSRERQTGGTRMNEKSSRSHAIFSVTLAQARTVSKLHFVDLAGSERLKKTLAVGERQREGIAINSGLLALGNVISALGDPQRPQPSFVPYRDSKLTHMLRDSLGGSAQTLLIACVSQAESNVAESLNTLKYAARARNIRNRGGVNVVATRASSREIDALRAVVRRLKAEVHALTDRLQIESRQTESRNSQVESRNSQIESRNSGQLRPLAFSPPADAQTLAQPSRIPMGAALQRRALQAEESGVLRARNQALEGELEQLNDTYTELLLKFNDACREIEDRQSEGFERDQRLRDREQEIRRLTAHSRRTTADPIDSVRQKRRSLRVESAAGDSLAAELPQLPDLARLRLLRSETSDTAAPGAAEFDAVLEECDANVRQLEAELRTAHDALAAVRLQLDMQETRASFADKLTASQVAQIDALRAQLAKARDAGLAEEERRRAADAELEDAALAYDAQLEAVANEWRQELQHVDEQWNERWDAADAERAAQIEDAEQRHAANARHLQSENARLRAELASLYESHEQEIAALHASHEEKLSALSLSHDEKLQALRLSHDEKLQALRLSHEQDVASLDESHQQELSYLHDSHEQEIASLHDAPPVVVTQLLSPPPTASEDAASPRAPKQSDDKQSDDDDLRAQALDAEARASAAEAALAALAARMAAKDEPPARSLSSDLPRRTADRIILCARNSLAHDGSADVTPSELRLRNVRHRYSTVTPSHPQHALQQPDRFASYPELRLASSPREAPSHAPPVYDEDQIQRMLRDAAAEVDDFADAHERADLLAEIARLKESRKDLQERNSQMQNLMRDLGDRLVGLAEENDQLEIKANDRDRLHAEVQRLTQDIAKYKEEKADSAAAQRRLSIESFRSADSSTAVDQLQTRLDVADAELAAAMLSVEEHQNHVTELMHDADIFRRRIQDLDDDLAQTMRQLDNAREDSRRVEQLSRAQSDADAELKRQRTLVACLQESLAASEENAEEAKLASDRFANELMRVQAETRALAEQADELQRLLQDARAMVANEARDRDVWKGRCQDLREEVDELRVRRRQNKILCF